MVYYMYGYKYHFTLNNNQKKGYRKNRYPSFIIHLKHKPWLVLHNPQ